MASLAHLKLFLELAVAVVPEVAPGALAVVVVGPGLEKASLEGPSQRWVVPVVAVALAEPTPSAGMQAALDPSPLPHCCCRKLAASLRRRLRGTHPSPLTGSWRATCGCWGLLGPTVASQPLVVHS